MTGEKHTSFLSCKTAKLVINAKCRSLADVATKIHHTRRQSLGKTWGTLVVFPAFRRL